MNLDDEMSELARHSTPVGRKKEYRLIYLSREAGIWKRVEFSALDRVEAIKRASLDAMGRKVEVWENGKFVCHYYKCNAPRDSSKH